MPRTGRTRLATAQNCVHCGKEFMPIGVKRVRLYCGTDCYHAAKRLLTTRDGQKLCGRCNTWKPFDQFVKSSASRTGYHSYCKPCSSEWFHERRGTPVEKRKAYVPAYTVAPEEKKRRQSEYMKKRRKQKANYIAMHNRLRRHRERAAGPMPHPFEIGRMLCEQDARCPYCNVLLSGAFHVDHKTPITRGGSNDMSNLQITCPTCNMSKGAKTHEEFLLARGLDGRTGMVPNARDGRTTRLGD